VDTIAWLSFSLFKACCWLPFSFLEVPRIDKWFVAARFYDTQQKKKTMLSTAARIRHRHRGVTRGTIPRAPKSPNNVTSTFFKTILFPSERRQVRTWGRQIRFLPRAPSNLVTSLRRRSVVVHEVLPLFRRTTQNWILLCRVKIRNALLILKLLGLIDEWQWKCCRPGVANTSIAIDRSIAESQLVDRA